MILGENIMPVFILLFIILWADLLYFMYLVYVNESNKTRSLIAFIILILLHSISMTIYYFTQPY